MSRKDKERWDKKWSLADQHYSPHPLLVDNSPYLQGGLALDLACGLGQNTIWLARLGYLAWGLDISPVALQVARAGARAQGLSGRTRFWLVDLDSWLAPGNAFDLICVFRFLDRGLLPQIQAGVRPGGLVFYGTRHRGALDRHPQANKEYLLRSGELVDAFAGWRILHYEEGPVDARLIAQKPGASRWNPEKLRGV